MAKHILLLSVLKKVLKRQNMKPSNDNLLFFLTLGILPLTVDKSRDRERRRLNEVRPTETKKEKLKKCKTRDSKVLGRSRNGNDSGRKFYLFRQGNI